MILALSFATTIFGFLYLRSCRSAEASYRAAVEQRLKTVCGEHALTPVRMQMPSDARD